MWKVRVPFFSFVNVLREGETCGNWKHNHRLHAAIFKTFELKYKFLNSNILARVHLGYGSPLGTIFLYIDVTHRQLCHKYYIYIVLVIILILGNFLGHYLHGLRKMIKIQRRSQPQWYLIAVSWYNYAKELQINKIHHLYVA